MKQELTCLNDTECNCKGINSIVCRSLLINNCCGIKRNKTTMCPEASQRINKSLGISPTHHAVCQGSPLFEMRPEALICCLEAQTPNEELSHLFGLARRLGRKEVGEKKKTQKELESMCLTCMSVKMHQMQGNLYNQPPPQSSLRHSFCRNTQGVRFMKKMNGIKNRKWISIQSQ